MCTQRKGSTRARRSVRTPTIPDLGSPRAAAIVRRPRGLIKTALRTSAIFPALFVLASCGSKPPTAPTPPVPTIVSLVGSVITRGGATLSGATVRIDDGPNAGKSATTNEHGEYRFDGLIAGNGNVSAVADGYDSVTTGINIDGRTPLNFNLLTSEPWSKSGTGDAVFYIPRYINQVHVVGVYTGVSSRFIVRVGTCAIVDDRLGTSVPRTSSDGTFLVLPAGNTPERSDSEERVEIIDSPGVAWSITEDRSSGGATPCYLY